MILGRSSSGNRPAGEPRVVVPVDTGPKDDPTEFPGLAATSIKKLFLDGKLLINTQWRSFADIVAVDLESGAVEPFSPRLRVPEGQEPLVGSWTCLAASSRGSCPHAGFGA